MFCAAPLLPLLVGNGFSQSILALRWLCLIPFFRSFQWCAGDVMAGAGYQSTRLATQMFAASFNFAVNLYLIPRYSWVGAAWASLATDGGLALLHWVVVFWLAKRNKYAYSIA